MGNGRRKNKSSLLLRTFPSGESRLRSRSQTDGTTPCGEQSVYRYCHLLFGKIPQTKKDDTEVQRELFRLYLTTGYEKEALEILEEIRFQGKKKLWNFLKPPTFALREGSNRKTTF